MPFTMDVAYGKQYSSLVYLLAQQKGSKFASKVRHETVSKAEEAYFNTLAPADEPTQVTTVHPPTPLTEALIGRRRVLPLKWDLGTPLDQYDLDRMVIEPSNWIVQNHAHSLGRKQDKIIIDAALGTAYIGKEGASTATLASESRSINGDGTITALGTAATNQTETAMTLAKMLAMLQLFNEADVDPDITKYWAVSPNDIKHMLNLTEVGSADYNTVKALTQGKVDSFAGFNFFWSNLLPRDTVEGTSTRTVAWAEDGIILATIGDITTRMDERADLSYMTQIYSKMDLGAVRMEGAKVHECLNLVTDTLA